MGFHRNVTPTYPGGLPAGYDYFNNPFLNGDPGAAAPADGKKSSGPNEGTYMAAFGEDATSSNLNRGLKALSENTDILDDYTRAGQPVMRFTNIAGGGSPVSSVVLSVSNVYVGSPSDAPPTANDQATRNRLFKVVDQNDNEIEVSGVTVVVTAVDNGSGGNYIGNVAGGFQSSPTLTFSPAIPAGVNYRIYYGVRRNQVEILTLKAGEYFYEQIRTAHRVDGDTQAMLRTLHNAAGSGTWNAAWPSTLDDLRYGGFERTYRNDAAKPSVSPDTDRYPLNVSGAGNGAWLRRDGKAVSFYSNDAALYVDPSQALLRLVETDTTQQRGTVPLLIETGFRDSYPSNYPGESDRHPGFASMLVADVRRNTASIHASNPNTRIIAGSSVTLTSPTVNAVTGESVVELAAGNYFKGAGGTDVVLGFDLIRLRYTQSSVVKIQDFVITAFGSTALPTSATRCRIRTLAGNVPDFTGASAATVVEWLRWSFGRADGSGDRYIKENGGSAGSTPISSAEGYYLLVPGSSSADVQQPPTGQGLSIVARTALSPDLDQFPLFRIGRNDAGAVAVDLEFLSGDPTNSSGLPTLTLKGTTLLSSARAISSKFGTLPLVVTSYTWTSATTTQALALNSSRHFKITGDSTVTFGQSVTLTFDAVTIAADLVDGMRMFVRLTQQSSGSGDGTLALAWPAAAKFSSDADKQPAQGENMITHWEGIYDSTTSAWYFTKRVF